MDNLCPDSESCLLLTFIWMECHRIQPPCLASHDLLLPWPVQGPLCCAQPGAVMDKTATNVSPSRVFCWTLELSSLGEIPLSSIVGFWGRILNRSTLKAPHWALHTCPHFSPVDPPDGLSTSLQWPRRGNLSYFHLVGQSRADLISPPPSCGPRAPPPPS